MENKFIQELRKFIGGDDCARKDLFALAGTNDVLVANEFERLLEGNTDAEKKNMISELMTVLNSWGLSMNLTERKVFWVCKNKRMCTTYDMVKDAMENKGINIGEALKEQCNDHLELRLNFNRSIKDEEFLKYTAINVGGFGLKRFGGFCFFFENASVNNLENIAFIKGNSLEAYTDGKNNLDIERLTKEVSTKKCVREMVAIKYSNEINTTPKHEWPEVICCNRSYVEGVVCDELKLDIVTLVKVASEYHDQFNKAALDIRYGEEVASVTGDFTARYLNALDALNAAGINVSIA